MSPPDWIAVERGARRLRAWAMAGTQVLDTAASEHGTDGFEAALLAVIGGWLAPGRVTPVIACGVVDAVAAATSRAVPCTPLAPVATAAVPTNDSRLALRVIPGLQQARPVDVMHGAESTIAGYLARNPGWDGVLCLPGPNSAWVHLSAGEVVSFQTFLTGELFALLCERSSLRQSVTGWDNGAFVDAVRDAMDRPERLAARLAGIRAEVLITGLAPDAARARLSGLLIGAELAAAKPYWLGQRVAVVGARELSAHYTAALAMLAVPATSHDATEMTLAGLIQARSATGAGTAPCAH